MEKQAALKKVMNALNGVYPDMNEAPGWFRLVYSIIDYRLVLATGSSPHWKAWAKIEKFAAGL